jgi:hypothetical protein
MESSRNCRHCSLPVSSYLGCQDPCRCTCCNVCNVFFCNCGNRLMDATLERLVATSFQPLPARGRVEIDRSRFGAVWPRPGRRITRSGRPQIDLGELTELLHRQPADWPLSFEHYSAVPGSFQAKELGRQELVLNRLDPRTLPNRVSVASFMTGIEFQRSIFTELFGYLIEDFLLWGVSGRSDAGEEIPMAIIGIAVGRYGVEISTSPIGGNES